MATSFPYGKLCMTPGISELVNRGYNFFPYLQRHLCADWGDICDTDKMLNNQALQNSDERLFSAYQLNSDLKIWIITEHDRSATMLLLPDEY